MFVLICCLLCNIHQIFAFDCSAPRDTGTFCDQTPPTRQFFFDSRTKVCQPFSHHGCGGNDNRFATLKECRDTCQKKRGTTTTTTNIDDTNNATSPNNPPFVPRGNKHEQWRQAELCGGVYLVPNGEYTLCSPNTKCPKYHSCVNGACCPSKDYVCSLRDDTGNFKDGIEDRPRFAWSHEVHSCIRYSYYGMNGNYNNFPNFQSCVKYCRDAKKIDM